MLHQPQNRHVLCSLVPLDGLKNAELSNLVQYCHAHFAVASYNIAYFKEATLCILEVLVGLVTLNGLHICACTGSVRLKGPW